MILEFRALRNRPPQVILDDKKLRPGVSKQLQVFCRSQLVIERNKYSANLKNGVRRSQPLRLIGHDDGATVSGIEIGILKSARERRGNLFEI